MAFDGGKIISRITLDHSKFSKSAGAVKKQTRAMGAWAKKNSGQFKAMGVAVVAMGAVAVATFKKMVTQYVETGDWIDKMSKRTGFSATALSELAHAADISGASLNDIEKSVKRMARTITDAGEGLESYLRPLERMGLSYEELKELSPEEQFMKITSAMAAIEDPTLRAATAQEVFGRAGTTLLPLMAEGAEGLKKLREEAHELGIIFDEEAAAKAAKLKDEQTRLTKSIQGLGFAIVKDLIPVITQIVTKMKTWFVDNREHASTWVKSLLGAFQFIARGIAGLLLAWNSLKTGVFVVAQAITNSFVKIAEGLLWIAKLTPGTEIFYAEKLRDLIRNLKFVSEEYRLEKEKGIDTLTNITIKYEAFVATLNKVKAGLDKAKKAQADFSTVIVDTSIPAARDMTGILEAAQPTLESYTWATEEMTEAQKVFSMIAVTELANMEASMQGFVTAMLNTLEQWAIGEIIAKVMKALPFPFNLLAVGGAIFAVKSLFAALKPKEKAEGGWVGLHGEEIVKVGEKGPEYISSNETITNIIAGGVPAQLQKIIIQNRITIGEQTFYKESIKSVNKAGELGDLIVPNKVVV